MTVAAADWITLAGGRRVVLCALVAGYPHPIVSIPSLTDVVWSDGSDAAWHVGTSGITSKPWFDVPHGGDNDPPPVVITERVSPVRGELEIGAVILPLTDPRNGARTGEVSQLIANRHAMPAAALTATLSATDTTAHVETTAGFPSAGTGYVGRESVSWSSKTATTLVGLGRGLHGSRARVHAFVSAAIRPTVYANPDGVISLPFLLGRRVTLWVLPMTGATTATDPQLVFDGRVGPGVALRGAGWAVPLLHAIRSLEAKFRAVNVTLAGIRHGDNARGASIAQAPSEIHEPLAARWGNANVCLNTGDSDGWSPDAETFIRRWNRASENLSLPSASVRAYLAPDGRLSVRGVDTSGSTPETLTVCADWMVPPRVYLPAVDDTGDDLTFVGDVFPEAFVALSGTVHLSASDCASLPAVPTLPAGAAATGTRAEWTLRAEINGDTRVARMGSIGTTTVSLSPAYTYTDPFALRCLAPTTATLGLWVESSSWFNALQFGLLPAIDGFQGTDHLADSIDFVRVQQVVSQTGAALDPARRFDLTLEDGLIDLINNQCVLSGLSLCTYRGRLAVTRVHEVSPTEPLAAALTKNDLRRGEVPTLSEVHDGLATAWTLKLPGKRSVQIVDEAAEADVGKGDALEADGASLVNIGRLLESGTVDRLTAQAMAVLGPISRPYALATIPLTLKHAGLQVGDVVTLSDWLLPDGYGGRGLSACACQILGVSRGLGTGAVDIDVLISRPDLSGYAPEVLIAGIAGAVLTVDVTALGSDQGYRGFCDTLLPNGTARLDGGTSTFTVGDAVVLLELDSDTPATPESFNVAAVSGTSITLDGSPSAAFTAIVGAGNARVMLAFADAGTATTSQRRYAYIADGTTLLIDGADAARRYAN